LKGEKPLNCLVVQPAKFGLGNESQNGKPLGIGVPQTPLIRADDVIE
jgi:hypothetical protein